ncbi:MAG: OprD family outer membrane porin [Gammaproteobacteria bacterium]|nr:OprD family outer membrane porin [Gammaproteobacteria bacterium]
MKIKSILLLSLLLCANGFAGTETVPQANDPGTALTQGKLKALLRYSGQYRDTNLRTLQDSSTSTSSDENKRQYSAIGGYIGYETMPWFHTSIGATLYTANPIGNNPDDRSGLGGLYEADGSQDAYHVFGEAFIKFQQGDHLLKAGRQEMPDYRFVSLSNVRMTPITHEGVVYENTVFNKFQMNLAYIRRMKERNDDEFIDMAEGAGLKLFNNGKQLVRGEYDSDDYDASGYIGNEKEMNILGLLYKTETLSLEGWDYYIDDFINIAYLYGQYTMKPGRDLTLSLAAQYANQKDVGEHIAGNIDTWFYGLKLQAYSQGLTYFISYNEVDYNENSYDGGSLFVRWGTPQMFNSFQVQDSELAGTKSYGVGLQYDFGRKGFLPGVVMRLRYADYDLPDSLYQTDARQDRTETTFDLRYSFTKKSGFGIFTQLDGLSIQFRLAYNRYETDYDFNAYKQIHGYSFDSVTDDFIDARLYLDYRF